MPLLVAFFTTVLVIPVIIKFARKYKLVDDPKTHKHPAIIHKKPIPRAGGIAIIIGIIVSAVIFVPMLPQILVILFASILVVIVGVLDDKFDISPYVRFGTNILFAAVVVAVGVGIPFITNPFGGILDFTFLENIIPFIPQLLAIVWIVWVMNMLNWSKGVDGQMPGIAAIAAFVIGVASLRFPVLTQENIISAQLSFIVSGAAIGFLFYNFYPAKIFPGYSATVLGFLIGILSILSGVKLATALLVMGIPAVDAVFTIVRRVASKKSPFWHDKGHLHHLLLAAGWGQRKIALFYWIMSAILGFIALGLSSKEKLFAIILLLIVVVGMIVMLNIIVKKGKNEK